MTPSLLWKHVQNLLNATADGIPGNLTLNAAITALNISPVNIPSWKDVQRKLNISHDGIPGVQTGRALLLALRQQSVTPNATDWPKESEVEKYFGKPGEGLQLLDLPYPMKLSWDHKTIVRQLTCHSLVALPLKNIFCKILDHYGLSRISSLRLDLFGGCYNNRDKVGGATKSMHAYGIAVDLDPDHNQLKWDRKKAAFAGANYDAFWNIVESEKAVSLGRKKNYDWMHFQFAQPN